MRPHTAVVRDKGEKHLSSKDDRSKTISGSRTPIRSNRKSKRDKTIPDSKSEFLNSHNYSNDLSK